MAEMVLPRVLRRSDVREILRAHVDPDAAPAVTIRTTRGNLAEYPPEAGVCHPEGVAVVEDFLAGEAIRWVFWHAEFQYILKGTAEVTYTLAPWHDEVKTMSVGPGDMYMIPSGADITWRIAPGDPFRKLCVTMPAEPLYQEVPVKTEPYR